MQIIQKQGSISTVLNYVGVLIAYVNLIYILPLFLDLDEIGLFRLIIEIAMLFMVVFQIGSPYLIIRYFPEYEKQPKQLRSFFTLAILFAIMGIALMVGFYLMFKVPILNYFKEKSPQIGKYEWVFLSIASLMILQALFERIFAAQKIVILPTVVREVIYRIGLTLIVLLIGFKILSFGEGVNLWTAFYALGPIVLLILYKKQFGLKFTITPEVWNRKNLIKFLKYLGVVSMGAIGGGLSIKIDMIMTGGLLGLELLGVYATMVYIATVIEIPKRALVQISDPFIAEYHVKKDYQKLDRLYKKNSLVLLVVGFLLYLVIFAGLPYLFEIMPKGESFQIGFYAFLVLGIVKLISLLASISNQILLNSNEAWISSVNIILLAAISILLNYLFIPLYGIKGAAIATLLAVGFNHFMIMGYTYYKFKIHPFSKKLLVLTLFFTAMFALVWFSPKLVNPYVGIICSIGLVVFIYSFVVFKLNISPDANEMAIDLFQKMKKFVRKA